MTTNRSTSSSHRFAQAASGPSPGPALRPSLISLRRPASIRRRHRARVGGEPQRALGDPAGGAAPADAHLGPAAPQVPVAPADALPLDRPHRERQVAALGPATGALEQHHQGRLAVARPGRQVARRGQAGPAGRAHQDGVDTGEEVTGRLGPPVAGVGHEDDPAQIEPEPGGRHHPGVGQADGGAPAPGRRRRGQERQRQGGRAVAGLPRHGGGRPAPQGAAGEERGQRRGHRQGPPGHRRGGADPVGQPGGELPGAGTERGTTGPRLGKRTYVRTLARPCAARSGRQRPRSEDVAPRPGPIGHNAARMCGRFALYTPPARIARYFGATAGRGHRPRRTAPAGTSPPPTRSWASGTGRRDRPAEGRRRTRAASSCPSAGASSRGGPRTRSRAAASSTRAARRWPPGPPSARRSASGASSCRPTASTSGASRRPGQRQPHYFSRADGAPLAFAGLAERWRDKGAPKDTPYVRSCTVITAPGGADMDGHPRPHAGDPRPLHVRPVARPGQRGHRGAAGAAAPTAGGHGGAPPRRAADRQRAQQRPLAGGAGVTPDEPRRRHGAPPASTGARCSRRRWRRAARPCWRRRDRDTAAAGAALARAAASTKPAGSDLGAIEHVVFLMQENRSFDHYYGTLPRRAGLRRPPGGSPRGASPSAWPGGRDRTLLPFHLDTASGIGECTHDLDHSWPGEHLSRGGGNNDAFVATHTRPEFEGPEQGVLTMGYYRRHDLPFYYALADAFTICDNYHCSVLGPDAPEPADGAVGHARPGGARRRAGAHHQRGRPTRSTASAGTPCPRCSRTPASAGRCTTRAGTIYTPAFFEQHGLLISDAILPYFSPVPQPRLGAVPEGVPAAVSSRLRAPTSRSGQLPAVSWLLPPAGYDEHPPSPPALGEWFTSQVLRR